jgi:hypothetical protein
LRIREFELSTISAIGSKKQDSGVSIGVSKEKRRRFVIASPDLSGRGDPSFLLSLNPYGLPRRFAARNDEKKHGYEIKTHKHSIVIASPDLSGRGDPSLLSICS